jgi:hypothetical protein
MSLQDFVCRAEDLPKDPVDEVAEATQAEYLAEENKDDTGFVTKDSGERLKFESGMQRDVETGKKDYSLVAAGPMFERWAGLLTRGAIKYERNNWMKARGNAEEERFIRSAFRHFIQWFNGETDEDHAAAVFFNINGAEYVRSLRKKEKEFAGPSFEEIIEAYQKQSDKTVNQNGTGTNIEQHPFDIEEVVDKRMAQDGTSPVDPAAIDLFESKLHNGCRHIFYRQNGKYYVKVFDAETSQELEASCFHYLDDAKQSYHRKRENDNS